MRTAQGAGVEADRDLRVQELLVNLEPVDRRPATVAEGSPDAPVIVLMVESLRWDLAGVEPSPIPFLESLMSSSLRFDRAYATSSHSNLADLSVWYSQYPLRGERGWTYRRDNRGLGRSAFEVFHDLGYTTAYISSQNEKWGEMIEWLDLPEVDFFFHSEDYDAETWVNRDDTEGLISLIQKKIATAGKIEDSHTLGIAQQWIDEHRGSGPVLVGINLQNTHFGYVIPENGPEPFQPSVIDFPTVYGAWPRDRITDVRNRYLNAVYNVDAMIGRFVAFLQDRGIWDRCYFVVLGDSGEAFYEHGIANHSGPMFDEQVRTLFLIKTPGRQEPVRVARPVSHLDVFPILCELMGIPVPPSFQGVPLSADSPERPIFMHANAFLEQDVMLRWPWKLMITYSPPQPVRLYQLERDPGERQNLAGMMPNRRTELELELRRWREYQLAYWSTPLLFESYYPPRYPLLTSW